MARTPDSDPAPVTGGLPQRTAQLLRRYDAEPGKHTADFGDTGDAERYSYWMADLLAEWLDQFTAAAKALLDRMGEDDDGEEDNDGPVPAP